MTPAGLRDGALQLWRRATGGNALEVCLLAGAALSVLAVIGATVRAGVAETYREDLTFRGAIEETTALIENQGPAGVASYRRGQIAVGGSTLSVDSLVATGDSTRFASLSKGGFLRDQIELFNDYAARRAVGDWASRGGGAAGSASPSLFHLARTDSGYHYLSGELNGFALLVPSPFAEREWSTVRTADWSRGAALLGLIEDAHLSLGDSTLSAPYQLSGEACRVKGNGPASRLLYCRSSAGADVGEAFDLGFELRRNSSFAAGAALRLSRQSPFWWNGTRDTPPDVRAGDLLYSGAVGPVVLSDVENGILAGPQWLNGRAAFTQARTGTLHFFARAGRSLERPASAPLTLALDAGLSHELDARIDEFMAEHGRYLEAVSVVVADVATGEVKAVSESRPREGRALRAFEPLLLGSMVKPIVAAALLSQDPELADLVVEWGGPEVARVAGVELRVPFGNPANGCGAAIDFDAFLRCSSNQYAVELLVRSLQRSAARSDVAPGGVVPTELLEHSSLTNGLLALFDDVDVVSVRTPGRSDRLWRALPSAVSSSETSGTAGDSGTAAPAGTGAARTTPRAPGSGVSPAGSGPGGARVPGDRTLHPWASRPWFIQPETRGTPIDWLARFAFGGWENRWTLLGAAEAYARLATGREVQLTMLARPPRAAPFSRMDRQATQAFERVRRALETVGEVGTARGVSPTLRNVGAPSDSLRVLAKTGTLSEITARLRDDDVFLKTLAMVVGRPEEGKSGAALECGLVIVSYFEFRQDWRRALGAPAGAALPDLHRDFATAELSPALQESWRRMGVCGARSVAPAVQATP